MRPTYDDDDGYDRDDDDRPVRRTAQQAPWLGAASFFLSIASGAFVFVLIVIAAVLQEAQQRQFDDDGPEATAFGLAALLGLFGAMLALGLGIGGLCQSKAGKVLAGMGVAISACIMLGVAGLVLIGLMMG